MLDDESKNSLKALKTFSLGTWSPWILKDREAGERQACEQLLPKLFTFTIGGKLWPAKGSSDFIARNGPNLIKSGTSYTFDITRENVRGYEKFWCAGTKKGEYMRGTVVLYSREIDWSIFADSVLYGIPASHYQILKGSSSAAVRFALDNANRGLYSFLFLASNGVEHLEVFTPEDEIVENFETVSQIAKKPGWKLT